MRLLVPVDGSPPANRAARFAASLVRRAGGGEIILVNAQNPATLDVSDISAVMSRAADRELAARQSQAAMKTAVTALRRAHIAFTVHAEIGPTAEVVARLARELGVDQIVMGSHGLGALGRFVLGSVASEVIRRAPVPVTLVR